MSENYDGRDYDIVRAKVSKLDRKGNDITGDRLYGGGRHREDGTISALVYDIELLDSDNVNSNNKTEDWLIHETEFSKQRELEARAESIQLGLQLANNLFIFLADHPELIETAGNIIKDGVCFAKEGVKKVITSIKKTEVKKPGLSINNTMSSEICDISERKDVNVEEMTLEQAQKEYIDLFKDFIMMRSRAQRLANARIIDANVESIDVNTTLNLMNSIAQKYPELLDKIVQTKLFEMVAEIENDKERKAILSGLNIIPEERTSLKMNYM